MKWNEQFVPTQKVLKCVHARDLQNADKLHDIIKLGIQFTFLHQHLLNLLAPKQKLFYFFHALC